MPASLAEDGGDRRSAATPDPSALHDLVTGIVARFVPATGDDFDHVLTSALADLVAPLDVDRAHVFRYQRGGPHMAMTHEACRAGVASRLEQWRAFDPAWFGGGLAALHNGLPVVVSGYTGQPTPGWRPSPGRDVPASLPASLVAVPIFEDGRLEGFLGVSDDRGPRPWDDGVVAVLVTVADVVAGAMARSEAERQLRSGNRRLHALVQHATDAIVLLDADGTVQWASPALERVLGHPAADVATAAQRRSLMHPADVGDVVESTRRLLAEPGRVVQRCYRVRHADGRWRHVEETRTNLLDDPSVGGVVGNLRDVTEQRAAESRLLALARRDPLTGLANRRALVEDLHALLADPDERDRLAVLFVDLDHFKVVNDARGHQLGDHLLTIAAHRLRRVVGTDAVVSRFGGDEFVALARGVEGRVAAEALAQRIVGAFRRPIEIDGGEFRVTASVGVTLAGDRSAVDELVRNADAALYAAKARGRDRAAFFDDGLVALARSRLDLDTALHRALARREFRVHYQPIVSLEGAGAVGVEALLRWERPGHGLLVPGDFLHAAEDNGLIAAIGRWVLDEACGQAARWQQTRPGLLVAVNLAARQLSQPDLADHVAGVLARHGLPPSRLGIEVTETALIADLDVAASSLARVSTTGVRVAMDDFGTGFSSLALLRRLPLTDVKIDQQFVAGLTAGGHDAAIVEAVVTLATRLGLTTVAEGVETPAQLAALAELGATEAQGFLLGRPVPADDVPQALDEAAAVVGDVLAI